MLLIAGAFGPGHSSFQPLKRDVHDPERPLAQRPIQPCGMGQKKMADLPRGSVDGKQEVPSQKEVQEIGSTGLMDPQAFS